MKTAAGFTLIELLLVLAIIGIISAIAIPALLNQREKAKARGTQANASAVTGEIARAADDLREKYGAQPNVDSVVARVMALSTYAKAHNPYTPADPAYAAGAAGTTLGTVYLTAQSQYFDIVGKGVHPAVIVTPIFKGTDGTPITASKNACIKVVAID